MLFPEHEDLMFRKFNLFMLVGSRYGEEKASAFAVNVLTSLQAVRETGRAQKTGSPEKTSLTN